MANCWRYVDVSQFQVARSIGSGNGFWGDAKSWFRTACYQTRKYKQPWGFKRFWSFAEEINQQHGSKTSFSTHSTPTIHIIHTWLQKRTINLGNTWIPGSKWMVPPHVLSSERAKQLSFDIRKRSLLVITGLAAIAYAAASSTKSAAIFTQVCCVILCDFSLVQFNEILELKSNPWAPCPFLPC